MSNMSYIRFENTLKDLRDCYEHMDDDLSLHSTEVRFRGQLIRLCHDISQNCYEDEEE